MIGGVGAGSGNCGVVEVEVVRGFCCRDSGKLDRCGCRTVAEAGTLCCCIRSGPGCSGVCFEVIDEVGCRSCGNCVAGAVVGALMPGAPGGCGAPGSCGGWSPMMMSEILGSGILCSGDDRSLDMSLEG